MRFTQWADQHQFDKSFQGVKINGDRLQKGLARSWLIAECEAHVDHGAAIAARVTATRVATGALLGFGAPGAIIGALAKKNRQKIFLAITVPDDLILVELKAKHEGDARKFAAQINKAAAHFAAAEPVLVEPTVPPPPSVPAGWYPQGDVQRYWDGAAWTEHTTPVA